MSSGRHAIEEEPHSWLSAGDEDSVGSAAIRKLKKLYFRILCANCVPDSEDAQIGKAADLTCGRSAVSSLNRPLKSAGFQPASASDVCLCCQPGRRSLQAAKLVRSPASQPQIAHPGLFRPRSRDRQTQYKYLAHRCETVVNPSLREKPTRVPRVLHEMYNAAWSKNAAHCAPVQYCLALSSHY